MVERRVLLVEDDEGVRDVLLEQLLMILGDGADVWHSYDYPCAISRIDSAIREGRPFDFLMSDYDFPHGNGAQVIGYFNTTHPDVPVIAMSGQDRREDLERAGVHYTEFMQKPIHLIHLDYVLRSKGFLEEQ